LPRITGGPFKYVDWDIPLSRSHTYGSRYQTYAYDNLKKSLPFAKGHAVKQAVIAPSMLYLLYPLNGTVEGYSKDKFLDDLINEVRDMASAMNTLTHAKHSAKKTSGEHSQQGRSASGRIRQNGYHVLPPSLH
jgi:hypothetical protein